MKTIIKKLIELINFCKKRYMWIHGKNKKFVVIGTIILGIILFLIPAKIVSLIGAFLIFGTIFLLFLFNINISEEDDDISEEEDNKKKE